MLWSVDYEIKIWDTETQECLSTLNDIQTIFEMLFGHHLDKKLQVGLRLLAVE